ncbi:MAG: EAL domain-containing protein [Casimicrobiaceae bacterium]
MRPRLAWSLRTKLVAACVVVELGATLLVMAGSARLMSRTFAEQAATQTGQLIRLLDQALAAPLAERDYASVQQMLELLRTPDGIQYLVLHDHRARTIASVGWDPAQPLPPRDEGGIDLDREDATLHASVPIVVGGQALAQLDFGMSTAPLRHARDEFRRQSLLILVVVLGLSMILMAVIAVAITRHLAKLALASERFASGDFAIDATVETGDEVGRLGASLNAMAATIRQRVAALERSEQQQREHLEAARNEQARLGTLLSALHIGILFVDADHRIIYANAMFLRIWGLDDLPPGCPLAAIGPRLVDQVVPDDAACVGEMLETGAGRSSSDHDLRTLDGRLVTQRMQRVAAGSDGGGYIWLHQDITLDRKTQERAQQAVRDPLTDLLNRRGLYDALEAAIAHAVLAGTSVMLMFIDLDDFKYANDIAGHRFGDEILVAVARALASQLRQDEIVARLGGDEFAVLSPGVSAEGAGAVAARLIRAVAALKFEGEGQQLPVSCSIGVALFPDNARTADELLARADTAMYQAKQGGKNDWCLYRSDAAYSRAESSRMNWNERIHSSLRHGRLRLQFQPVYSVTVPGVAYHEALLRMVDEADPAQLIPPSQFVPHAERSGKIRQIDRWVFETCIEKLAHTNRLVCIAVNLSARSLDDATFVAFMRETLQRRDVDPRRLHIELTETAAIGDLVTVRPMIAALRALGCAVHLDDFGSGFSSFSHLRLLEVDSIKIDGSFIRNLRADASAELVVGSFIKIAHSMNKTTVAECVEDAETLATLRRLGIDYVQGFYLGRPADKLVDSRAEVLTVVAATRGIGMGAT